MNTGLTYELQSIFHTECNGHGFLTRDYMVVSPNRGTRIQTPKYYSPCYGDPQNGTLNYGKPPILGTILKYKRGPHRHC